MAFFPGTPAWAKSTHTGLWHQLLGTPFLNGDLNLLGIHENRIMVYGIPWCGTSGIYTTKNYELGGIVLLGRNPYQRLSGRAFPLGPDSPGNAKNDFPGLERESAEQKSFLCLKKSQIGFPYFICFVRKTSLL